MHRRWILSALAVLLSVVLAACTTATTQQPQANVTPTTKTANTNSQAITKRISKKSCFSFFSYC